MNNESRSKITTMRVELFFFLHRMFLLRLINISASLLEMFERERRKLFVETYWNFNRMKRYDELRKSLARCEYCLVIDIGWERWNVLLVMGWDYRLYKSERGFRYTWNKLVLIFNTCKKISQRMLMFDLLEKNNNKRWRQMSQLNCITMSLS